MKKKCLYCHKEYTPHVSRDRWEKSKYCSARCKQLGWGNKKERSYTCKECAALFTSMRKKVFCTDRCRLKFDSRKAREKQKKERVSELKKANFGKIENGVVSFENTMLTLKNYKEPLKKILQKDGYGWYGTIALTTDGKMIQCHKCGDLKASLPMHIIQRHKMDVSDYREAYGLSPTTALISETTRMGLKERELERIKKFTPEQKAEYMRQCKLRLREARKVRTHYQPKESLESKNKKGTCPDQLLDKIKYVKEQVGHVPSKKEFARFLQTQRFIHLIYKVYGSWEKAIKLCNFKDSEDTRKERQRFVEGGKGRGRAYEEEELLELLRIYTQENQSIPTATDFKRDFLPNLATYTKRFKTIENARQLAGVYQILGETKGILTSKSKYLRHTKI